MARPRVHGNATRYAVLMAAPCFLLSFAVPAQPFPWHLEGWNARCVIRITEERAGVDTCGVKILCQGRARADGADYRVVDEAGNAVPFQLAYHDPERYSLLSFRATDPKQPYLVYYGNPGASRAAEQAVAHPAPGSGPPKGDWIPKCGLVFATIERPEVDNPKTAEEMVALLAASPMQFGAQYQQRIADGYNPFGRSDMYISVYRGWLNVPVEGEYGFCTVSNEASFSFLDGQELVHWPGRHTTERGQRGEKNARVSLSAGPHYIEYYHEEVYLQQMAYLGWRPPNAEGKGYSSIPEAAFPAPLKGTATRYETRVESGEPDPLPTFEPQLANSMWPVDRHEGQYTRFSFVCPSADSSGVQYEFLWDFGDGQASQGAAQGAAADHVFLAPGLYPVSLTVRSSAGAWSARWPLLVYDVQHVTDQVPEGTLEDYVEIARTYDQGTLGALQLKELAHLFAEAEALADAAIAGKRFVERFGESNPEWLPEVRRLVAECALRQGEGGVDEAIAHYRAAVEAEPSPVLKLDSMARLIRLVGVERNLVDEAEALLGEVEATTQGAELDEAMLAAYRRTLIAAGDAYLWNDRADDALSLYRKSEARSPNPIPIQVRAARTGAYPESISLYLAEENYGAALDVVDQWEQTFPTEKFSGRPLFWRGKALALRGQPQQAIDHLAVSVRLGVGAEFETEARWLLAESLEAVGKPDEARRELAELTAIGMKDPFSQRAEEKLQGSPGEKGNVVE